MSFCEKEKIFELTVVGDGIDPLVQRRVELGDDVLFPVLSLPDEAEKDSIVL